MFIYNAAQILCNHDDGSTTAAFFYIFQKACAQRAERDLGDILGGWHTWPQGGSPPP
jgi:hypothetical protein